MTPRRLLIGEVMKNRRQVAAADPWNYREIIKIAAADPRNYREIIKIAVADPWNYRTRGLLLFGEIIKIAVADPWNYRTPMDCWLVKS